MAKKQAQPEVTENVDTLNSVDARNMLTILNRATFTGAESETVSVLKYKLAQLITEEPTQDK